MKLKRVFIDVKRLATISINYIVRTQWLLDYVKSIAKPLEYTNNQNVDYFKNISTYTLYNGQKLTLKTFVDDFYDIENRRTLIEEGNEESYSFYGYIDESGNYVNELDPNETSFNGYSTLVNGFMEYTLEDEITGNQPLYGYIKFNPGTNALQDVDDEYILDNYYEYIYTAEDGDGAELNYMWFLEDKSSDGLIIYLHDDVYNSLSTEELEFLYNVVAKYIIQPYRYTIDKYS